jgi:chorismate dehydratase
LRLLPGICIASRGAVWTVLLIAKAPLAEVRSVALDNRSRTSAALLRILFEDRFHPEVKYLPAAPDVAEMLKIHDAALIIGDPALNIEHQGTNVYDLSEEWFERTGNTFVHAVVAARPGVSLTDEMTGAIRAARQEAPGEIAGIAKIHAGKYARCEDYLRHRIRYELGEEELLGLAVFRDLCHERGLIPQKRDFIWAEDR